MQILLFRDEQLHSRKRVLYWAFSILFCDCLYPQTSNWNGIELQFINISSLQQRQLEWFFSLNAVPCHFGRLFVRLNGESHSRKTGEAWVGSLIFADWLSSPWNLLVNSWWTPVHNKQNRWVKYILRNTKEKKKIINCSFLSHIEKACVKSVCFN